MQRGRIGAIHRQRAQRTHVGLLHEVVGVVARAEERAQLPHPRLGLVHEPSGGDVVAFARRERQPGQLVHRLHSARAAKLVPVNGNSWRGRDDLNHVRNGPTCAEVQEAISALLDGEEPNVDTDTVDRHTASCDACAAFRDAAAALHAAVRVRPAPQVPDRTRAILSAASAPDRAPVWMVVRVSLGVVALVEGAIFMPAFLYGNDGEGVPTHAARHLGAFGLAFAVALLVVAIRPRQARSLVPMTVTLTVAMMAAAIVDTINGKTSPFLEAHHLLEVLGTTLVWLLAVPASWPRRERRRADRFGPASVRLASDVSDSPSRKPPNRKSLGQAG